MIDKLRVVRIMKINSEHSKVFIFHNSDHEEFIKLILLLICFAQRLSFPCDTKKRVSVVTIVSQPSKFVTFREGCVVICN